LGLNAPPPSFYERFSSCASVAQRSDGLRPVETQEPAIASQTADTGNTVDDPHVGSTSINGWAHGESCATRWKRKLRCLAKMMSMFLAVLFAYRSSWPKFIQHQS